MHEALEAACTALDNLGAAALNGWGDDRPLNEGLGWFAPAITRQGLSNIPKMLAIKIRSVGADTIDSGALASIKAIPKRLALIQSNTIPQMYNGNAGQAVPAYLATLDWVRQVLEPILGWQSVDDPKLMPAKLATRVKNYSTRLNRLDAEIDGLEAKVTAINNAHDAADSLPATMQDLEEARSSIQRIATELKTLSGDVERNAGEADRLVGEMNTKGDEAAKLINQCEEAYRVTTTKGLAGAFDERAVSLRESMRWWVIGLSVALIAGGKVGTNRIDALSEVFSSGTLHWETVFAHLLLTVLGVGGPLWFAWVATKQIGHRFRLAEDYAFKASVAKAYEGYRREAASIDEVFEARLFSTALMRLEEAPLRLVEETTHGSPWHEFMTSPVFKQAAESVPDFKETLAAIFKKGRDAAEGFSKKPAEGAKTETAEG